MARIVRQLKRGLSPPREAPPPRRRLTVSRDSPFLPPSAQARLLGSATQEPRSSSSSGKAAPAKRLTSAVVASASKRMRRGDGGARTKEDLSLFPVVTPLDEARAMWDEIPRGREEIRRRVQQLAKEATGHKRFREALAKRARARRRQQRHTWALRACKGLPSVLEEIAMSPMTSKDFRRRLGFFWDFCDLHRLPVSSDRDLDNACTDWADLEYLLGEGFSDGEKLKIALERWALIARPNRIVSLPRFAKALRSWRKNSPRRSRLPMPELYMWILAGAIGAAGEASMALYLAALFASYLRPSALLNMYCDDVVSPETADQGVVALLVSPIEKERSTKTGQYDETVLMDGDIGELVGPLLKEQADKRLASAVAGAAAGAEADGLPTPLWEFSARNCYSFWKGAAELVRLPEMETVYQARHGGASRDALRKTRSQAEIQARLHHATATSSRIYDKPARILKLENRLTKGGREYASDIRRRFAELIRSGKFPEPPLARGLISAS